jgi:hypothetical protein
VFISSKDEYFDPVGSPLYDVQELYLSSLLSHEIKIIIKKKKILFSELFIYTLL